MLVWQWLTVYLNLFLSVSHRNKIFARGICHLPYFLQPGFNLAFYTPLLGSPVVSADHSGVVPGSEHSPGLGKYELWPWHFTDPGENQTLSRVWPGASFLCLVSFRLWYSQIEHPWPTAINRFPFSCASSGLFSWHYQTMQQRRRWEL